MGFGDEMRRFYKRWNIEVQNHEEWERFKQRALYAVSISIGDYVLRHPLVALRFDYFLGKGLPDPNDIKVLEYEERRREGLTGRRLGRFTQTSTYAALGATETEGKLALCLQCLILALEEREDAPIDELADALKQATGDSLFAGIRVRNDAGHLRLYPAGARLLDEGIVDNVLAWLEDYPAVAQHFRTALDLSMRKDRAQYRNLLDELRVALEELLKSLLKNRKSLENQKAPLGQWLQRKGVASELRNMYERLVFGHYADYHNKYVKHPTRPVDWSETDVDFMIYLTGTFMRLLLQVSQEDEDAKKGSGSTR